MKQLSIIFVLLILVFGCKKTTDYDKDVKFNLDSIKASEVDTLKIKKAIPDCIIKIEQDKVIGEIMFGMTKKEVKAKIDKFRKENVRQIVASDGKMEEIESIGEYVYTDIYVDYDEGKLYSLTIVGEGIKDTDYLYSYEDFFPERLKIITDLIKQKFGEPDYHYGFDRSGVIDRWEIGKKTVEVVIANENGPYCVNVEIFLPEILEKRKNNKEQKEKQLFERENKQIEKAKEKAKDVF